MPECAGFFNVCFCTKVVRDPAFDVADLKVAKQSLNDHDVAFTEIALPGTGRGQLFFTDPNGVNLEIGGPAE